MIAITGSVGGAFEREGLRVTSRVLCNLKIFDESIQAFETIAIQPVVMNELIAPIIIGLQSIGKHNLLNKMIPILCQTIASPKRPATHRPSDGAKVWRATGGGTPTDLMNTVQELHTPSSFRSKSSLAVRGTRDSCELCVLQVSSKDFFGDRDDSEDEGFEAPPPSINELLPAYSDGGLAAATAIGLELITKIQFEGPEVRKERLRNLCREYACVFAKSVEPHPAHVSQMNLEVDADLLRGARSSRKAAPRPQSHVKLSELKKMIE